MKNEEEPLGYNKLHSASKRCEEVISSLIMSITTTLLLLFANVFARQTTRVTVYVFLQNITLKSNSLTRILSERERITYLPFWTISEIILTACLNGVSGDLRGCCYRRII